MCTVSVVQIGGGFRIVCNRDERLTRPPAERPTVRRAGDRTALWPRDPFGGGTWIGANDAGLAMVLLNRTPRRPPEPPARPRSRGTIIPSLLESHDVASALRAAMALPASDFLPFTLVLVRGSDVWVVRNVGRRMWVRARARSTPLVFTSSSLGDHVVCKPRNALFARMVESSSTPLRAQVAFHQHRWPLHPEISVRMVRADSATVSCTVLDVAGGVARMHYRPLYR